MIIIRPMLLLPVVSLITVDARACTDLRRLSFIPVSTWSQRWRRVLEESFQAHRSYSHLADLCATSDYAFVAGYHLRPRQPRQHAAVASSSSSSSNNKISRGDQLDEIHLSRLIDRHIHQLITIITRANMNILRELYGCRKPQATPRIGIQAVLHSFPAQLQLSH